MAGNTAFILVFGLAGILAVPANQSPDDVSQTIVSSLPLEINNTFIPEPPISTRPLAPEAGKELVGDCELLCKVCNLTSKVINGSCRCLDNNGSEVMCTVNTRENPGGQAWVRDKIVDNVELDLKPEGEEDGVIRGERCLLTMARPQGVLQNMLGQGLKGMTTEERLAEFRKRVESLRRKPSFESDKTKECNRDTESPPEKDSAPLYVLPVSPFMNKNLGEKFQKDGKESVKIEEDNVPFIKSNLREGFQKYEKEAIKTEKENVEIVGEIKPSVVVTGDIAGMVKSSSCLANTPSPVIPAEGSSHLTESTGGSGIKLPAQFLALTKIRERMVDLYKIPEDSERPIEKGKEILPFLKPVSSITSMSDKVKPIAPVKLPDTNPMPIIISPSKIYLRDEILQSSPATSSSKLPVLPDQKKSYVSVLETGEKSSQCEKQGPILEGIIAIPKHVRIKKQWYNE